MVLFRLLEIDWSNLLQNGELIWAGIVTLGGGTIANILTFFKASSSVKKVTTVQDFAVVASKSMKYAKEEFANLKKEIVLEIKESLVTPLLNELEAVREDNTKLANLAVTALSLSPITLEQKKAMLPVLSRIGTVSAEAVQILSATISKEELSKIQEVNSNDQIKETISQI